MRIRHILAALAAMAASGGAQADIYTFDFTGRVTVVAPNPSGDSIIALWPGNAPQAPIGASLTFDSVTGLGTSNLSVNLDAFFLGYPAVMHDVRLTGIADGHLAGQLLLDWGGSADMPVHIDWDASGLLAALELGLRVGDKLSGERLYRDANQDRVWDAGELIATLPSASPYTDSLLGAFPGSTPQYAAPLAATSATQGFTDGPFQGIRIYLDIGSGNSMYVTAISPVPEPESWVLMAAGLALVSWSARRRSRA